MAQLLGGVDAVVTHGGAGTVLAALSKGLPMVVAPVGADQPLQGGSGGGGRCGHLLRGRCQRPGRGRTAVMTVLADTSYAEKVIGIAGEIAAMASPADVAASRIRAGSAPGLAAGSAPPMRRP